MIPIKLIKKNIYIIIVLMMLIPFSYAMDSWSMGSYFYGEANINGEPVPVGATIYAKMNGTNKGSIDILREGLYGEGFEGDESSDQKFLVRSQENGATINFFIKLPGKEEIEADETSIYAEGKYKRVDLNFNGELIDAQEEDGGSQGDTNSNSGDDDGSNTDTTKKTNKGGGGSSSSASSGGSSNKEKVTTNKNGSISDKDGKIIFHYDSIEAGNQIIMDFDNVSFFIDRFQFITNKDFENVTFEFTVDEDMYGSDAPYRKFSFVSDKISAEDLDIVIARFRVSNDWLESNGYDPKDIRIYSLEDSKSSLEIGTIFEGADLEFSSYRAAPPSFGEFEIDVLASMKKQDMVEKELSDSMLSEEGLLGDEDLMALSKDSPGSKITGFAVNTANNIKSRFSPYGFAMLLLVAGLIYGLVVWNRRMQE